MASFRLQRTFLSSAGLIRSSHPRPMSSDGSALVEIKPGEIGMVSGIPQEHLRRRVVIYSPARTASQQGSGKVGRWKINFMSTQKKLNKYLYKISPPSDMKVLFGITCSIEDLMLLVHSHSRQGSHQSKPNEMGSRRWENPLMGWTSTGDPYANVGDAGLGFDSEEAAKEFAEKHGWDYMVKKPHTPLLKLEISYNDREDNINNYDGQPKLTRSKASKAILTSKRNGISRLKSIGGQLGLTKTSKIASALETPFMEKEIQAAIFQSNGDEAPRPNENQSALIPGRVLQDGFIVVQECILTMHKDKRQEVFVKAYADNFKWRGPPKSEED
ncbi:hypothetical protein QJS10_CPA05g01197 [Acorus calamus]|uniref:NADH dehydrogenase [ubiquinone] iron-sulfur protein 4, mitochondrial n=1 Tax=Acorus calamus TaxID=4465 RepID=A0AAV9ETE9_ACOCL|nr:hypothetical protein QJS10_CPA05g01197 [Acorus calamus]